jgi:hypothetical protein
MRCVTIDRPLLNTPGRLRDAAHRGTFTQHVRSDQPNADSLNSGESSYGSASEATRLTQQSEPYGREASSALLWRSRCRQTSDDFFKRV